MTKYQKAKKILVFLTLFSLSLLILAPLAGLAFAQPSNTSLLTSTISATQTPENITVGQTWTYRLTYQNDTHTGSCTFTQKITSIKNITDWNGSTQECYVLQTKINNMYKLYDAFYGGLSASKASSGFVLTVEEYINTTNYSNPRTHIQHKVKYPDGYSIDFRSYLRNGTFNIWKFPLYNGLSWENIVNESKSMWWLWPSGVNMTFTTSYRLMKVNASVAGPVNVTVPEGTYETYKITYTNDTVCELFCVIFGVWFEFDIDQVQGWYSLEAGNFVKYFMEADISYGVSNIHGNVTIELVPSAPTNIMLALFFFFSAQQQQGSSNVFLTVGLIVAVAVIGSIGIVIFLARRGG